MPSVSYPLDSALFDLTKVKIIDDEIYQLPSKASRATASATQVFFLENI